MEIGCVWKDSMGLGFWTTAWQAEVSHRGWWPTGVSRQEYARRRILNAFIVRGTGGWGPQLLHAEIWPATGWVWTGPFCSEGVHVGSKAKPEPGSSCMWWPLPSSLSSITFTRHIFHTFRPKFTANIFFFLISFPFIIITSSTKI